MKYNYFNFKKYKNRYLITNEMGFYYFLAPDEFQSLVTCRFNAMKSNVLKELQERLFIYDVDDDVFVENACNIYRDSKSYLFQATSLHIFVMTNACNMSCVYCQAQTSAQERKGLMSFETVEKAIEIALQAPGRSAVFEFQGGEPLLNFNTIRHAVEYTEQNKNNKEISYTVVTNTLLMTDEMICFFNEYKVSISTSLDGDLNIHDCNRPLAAGGGTYKNVCKNICRLQDGGVSVGAIQTTTKMSLKNPYAIVNAYKELNLHYIFIRPLTPLGYAKEHWNDIGYTADEFIEFYREVLFAIMQCNADGYFMVEGHASIFLRKILTQYSDNYMELRSPCGAGIGQMAYYYDGKIYTCDEGRMLAEMGMPEFNIGDVYNCTYEDLVDSRICKVTCQASVLEALPQCCDCVYHPYCGVCPIVNYAIEQNIYSREAGGYKCQIYKGILDTIFEYLSEYEGSFDIFKTWL